MWVGCFRFHGLLAAPPDPAGRPVVVVHRGVVWDVDPAARAVGVGAGQTAALARTRCPGAEVRSLDPAAAAPVLAHAWDLMAEAASIVEPDAGGRPEAYAAWDCADPPVPEVRHLRFELNRRLSGVELAAGLGGSRLAARAACPPEPGVALLPLGTEGRALARCPLEVLVEEGLLAPVLLHRLRDLGLSRCGQIAALPAAVLRARFGREGERLHALCRGRDARGVRALYPPRSIPARRAYPDGLPPGSWAAAASEVARQAARAMGAGEAARCLRLRVNGGEYMRTWRAPRRDAAVLARAAGVLGVQAAQGSRTPAEVLEVILEDLAVLPAVALSLLPPALGRRQTPLMGGEPDPSGRPVTRAGSRIRHPGIWSPWPGPSRPGFFPDRLLPPDAIGPRHPALDRLEEILSRLPRGALQRGCGVLDRYERLLGQLDPWGQAR